MPKIGTVDVPEVLFWGVVIVVQEPECVMSGSPPPGHTHFHFWKELVEVFEVCLEEASGR